LIKVWREINADPSKVVTLRNKYNVLPDIEKVEVDELEDTYAQGVTIDLYPANGGSAESVKQDFNFFTSSGSLKGDPAKLKVEDYWYLEPVTDAVKKLGKM